ncbi:hypothetical protein ACFPTO_11720 [Paraburkholderia denitrificans]|uniref:Uncharacterized protein n=1 Tax=Paraburkholderia denitrificans TaxID=694025 RepID=A0ABW0J8Q5_9BURK
MALYFVDTEFTNFDVYQLISIAIVVENGSEFYGEVTDFDRSVCSNFAHSVVLPKLGRFPDRAMSFLQLRNALRTSLDGLPLTPAPILCFDFEGDLKLVEHLLGTSLPAGWETLDIYSQIDSLDTERYFMEYDADDHHALNDARANRYAVL